MRFPQAAITFARRLNEANLPDICTASVPGEFTPDEEGGGTYGEPTTFEFDCRTWPLDARQMEALVDDQLREPGLEGLVYPVDIDLPVNATLAIYRHELLETHLYEVKGIIPDPTYIMERRAIIKRTGTQEEGS